MRKRSTVTFLGAMAAALLLGGPSAAAFDEVGNRCVGDAAETDSTVIVLDNGGTSVLPPQVFASGVITRWRVSAEPGIGPVAQRLVVLKPVDEEEDLMVAESSIETVVTGENEFATRIPVREHAHIGLSGPVETLLCDEEPAMTSGVVGGEFPIGERAGFDVEVGIGTPLIAIVEPDRDGDGYGDETQDRCPRGPAYQAECPTVTLGANATAHERSIVVWVNASSGASIHVFGQVGWSYRPKPGGDAMRPQRNRRLIVGLSGGTKEVQGGKATRFDVPLPKTVLHRLERLRPDLSLKAKITARATDLAGRVTNRRLTVKLAGQG